MKKIIFIISSLLLLSFSALAEEHADAALEHANAAIIQGKEGNLNLLTEHVAQATHHTDEAVKVATGPAKFHLETGSKHLHDAVKQANQGHGNKAIEHVRTAIEHLKAGNPKS